MGRNLVALAVIIAAFMRGELLHPDPFYSIWLPLLGVAAFVYLLVRLMSRGGRGGSSTSDGGSTGDSCTANDGDCGGDGGGGGD